MQRPIFLLQTSSAFFHIYKVQLTGKRLLIGGKQPSGLFLANISLVITEKTPFLEKNWTTYGTDAACTFSIPFGLFQRIFSFTIFSLIVLPGAILFVITKAFSLDFLMDIYNLSLGMQRLISVLLLFILCKYDYF